LSSGLLVLFKMAQAGSGDWGHSSHPGCRCHPVGWSL